MAVVRPLRRSRDSSSPRWRNSAAGDRSLFILAAGAQSALRTDKGSPLPAHDPAGWSIRRLRSDAAPNPLDAAQSAHAPPFPTAPAALCQRLRRAAHDRLQSLGEYLDRPLYLRAG